MKKTAAGPAAVRHAFTVIPTKDPFLHALAFSQTRISLTHKIGKAKVAVFSTAVHYGHGLCSSRKPCCMQYNSLKRKRESAFSPNPKKKQIFLPPKQPSRAPVSRLPQPLHRGSPFLRTTRRTPGSKRPSRKPLPARAVRAALPLKRRPKAARGTKMKKIRKIGN